MFCKASRARIIRNHYANILKEEVITMYKLIKIFGWYYEISMDKFHLRVSKTHYKPFDASEEDIII